MRVLSRKVFTMSISAIASPSYAPSSGLERAEGPGPDHDGDSDDVGAASAVSNVQSLPPPGTGTVVDVQT